MLWQVGHLWLAKTALKITKIKILSFREKNVRLFEVITKASVSSDKNVPLALSGWTLKLILSRTFHFPHFFNLTF